MREGIHLGPPLPRWTPVFRALFLSISVLTLVLGVLYYRARLEVFSLREDLAGRDGSRVGEPPAVPSDVAPVVSRLRSVRDSGALGAIAPTDTLQMVAKALPGDMRLVAVSLKASKPNPSLILEARAGDAGSVTRLERQIGSSKGVVGTRLLEERRGPDGTLAVRLQVDLSERTP